MKRLWLVVAVALLTAACHRGGKEKDEAVVADTVAVAAADTLTVFHADTVKGSSRIVVHEVMQDSAEVTNLRLFTRKQRVIYDPALLAGEWINGSEHEQYIAGGGGKRWDTGDDVSRSEAQSFNWTMDSNLLTIKYTMAFGGLMIRMYVVTYVDDETLVYRDSYGDSYMWEKVPSGYTDRPVSPEGVIVE